MEVEDEDCGGYDDECFEEYSDEFDGEGEDERPPPPVAKATAAAVTRPGSARGKGAGAVVSPPLKMRRPGDNIQAPDDKVWSGRAELESYSNAYSRLLCLPANHKSVLLSRHCRFCGEVVAARRKPGLVVFNAVPRF